MPRPTKKTQYTEKKQRSIYILLNPHTKEFYIDYTLTNNVRQLYIEHCLGNRQKTKDMVYAMKQSALRPCCFELCEINCTKVEAYRAVIVWTKIFVERGYKSVDRGNVSEYIHDVFGATEAIYRVYKNTDITKILDCHNCLFPTYKRQECPTKAGEYNATD